MDKRLFRSMPNHYKANDAFSNQVFLRDGKDLSSVTAELPLRSKVQWGISFTFAAVGTD